MKTQIHNIYPAFLFIFLNIFLQHYSCEAQNSQQDYLDAHNNVRSLVGVGPMTWDENVATYARNYVNQRIWDCGLVYSNGPYGQNIAEGGGDFSGQQAVDLWVQERSNYDYATNSCIEEECLHYTQVEWCDSVRLGCARAQCITDGSWFISCNYDPPGNFDGQHPY